MSRDQGWDVLSVMVVSQWSHGVRVMLQEAPEGDMSVMCEADGEQPQHRSGEDLGEFAGELQACAHGL